MGVGRRGGAESAISRKLAISWATTAKSDFVPKVAGNEDVQSTSDQGCHS